MTDADRLLEASQIHRPRDRDTMRCAAVELRQRGLTVRDIAEALQISESAVRQLLLEPPERSRSGRRA